MSPFHFAYAFKTATGLAPQPLACRTSATFDGCFEGTWACCRASCARTARLDPVRVVTVCEYRAMTANPYLFFCGDVPLSAQVHRATTSPRR
jgi:hypothetical protein